jgi:cell division protein FtsB
VTPSLDHFTARLGRGESGRPAARTALGAALVLVVAAGLAVYGGSGVMRVRAMQEEIRQLEREVGTLRTQTEKLTVTIDRLRNDPAYIEKLAREDLGYVREGDTVLKFPATRPK